jgi:hypothetical protein
LFLNRKDTTRRQTLQRKMTSFSFLPPSITLASVGTHLVQFLTGNFYLSGELQSFWMAIQGCMMVRAARNPNKELKWFHAFCLSVLAGYAGGWFGFILMAKPTSMFYNDLNMASCIVAFLIVNCTPFDVGYKLCQTLPLSLLTVSFAQLFRSVAIPKFVHVCYQEFANKGTPYYPSIPVFGPILYATLLGNMGGFITKGIEGHVESGMPWPIQNGLVTASFYHFFVHDKTGVVGLQLRQLLSPLLVYLNFDPASEADQATFAACAVSLFMQIVGILQMPQFFGSAFSPFTTPLSVLWGAPTKKAAKASVATKVAPAKTQSSAASAAQAPSTSNLAAATSVNGNNGNKKRKAKKKGKNKVE